MYVIGACMLSYCVMCVVRVSVCCVTVATGMNVTMNEQYVYVVHFAVVCCICLRCILHLLCIVQCMLW